MTQKNLTSILDNLGSAWLAERLIELIDDKHRLVVDDLSQIDPMFNDNLFQLLRTAIIEKRAADVENVLAQFRDFDDAILRTREVLREVKVLVSAFPEVWGGVKDREVYRESKKNNS